MKILFLYTELAGYFLACVNELLKEPGVEVHIVKWPVNKEAPFTFDFPGKVKVYEREEYSQEQLIALANEISPSVIYCSGWIDKDYLAVCKRFKKQVPVIVGFDNQWKGTLKQRAAGLLAQFTIHRHFTHCWVPGLLQQTFARELGFSDSHILTGFYSCDFDFFHRLYLDNKEKKKKDFPRRLIYVGRYYEFKGIKDLWDAFIEIERQSPSGWELWCLGTGDIEPVNHEKIRHFGFVQPAEISKYIAETGVFVLPSHFEPWGVVVHEFAAAGFPLVCSDEVGARTAFVENGYNGYIYKAGDKSQLVSVLKEIMAIPGEELYEMGERSLQKAMQITPARWVKTLKSVLR